MQNKATEFSFLKEKNDVPKIYISKNLQVPFRRLQILKQIHMNCELLISHHVTLRIVSHMFSGRVEAEGWSMGFNEAIEQIYPNLLLPLIVNMVTVLRHGANIGSNIRLLAFKKVRWARLQLYLQIHENNYMWIFIAA